MPRKKTIPDEVREQVVNIVTNFNQKTLKDFPYTQYIPRFQGKFLYLGRSYGGAKPAPICRLKYQGKMNNWEFAIYKYSDNRYAPDEWLFPGTSHVDGTVEGAMRAGLEAYPE